MTAGPRSGGERTAPPRFTPRPGHHRRISIVVFAMSVLLASMLIGTVRATDVVDFAYDVFSDGSVHFEDVSMTDNGTAIAWTWDFGNGTNGTGRSVTHRYEKIATTVYVILRVTFNRTDGTKDRATAAKDVTIPPAAGGVACGAAIALPFVVLGLGKMARFRGKRDDRVRLYGTHRRKAKYTR